MPQKKPGLAKRIEGLYKRFIFRAPEEPSPYSNLGTVGASAVDIGLENDHFYKARIPEFLYKPQFGIPIYKNIPEIRRVAATPYVAMIRNTIVNELSELPWEIKAKDGEEVPESVLKDTESFFDNPNFNDESHSSILRKFVGDSVEVDAAVLNKIFDRKGDLVEIIAYDGATFTWNPNINGILPTENAYYQYGWIVGTMPIPFDRDEIVYVKRNPRTDSIYGRSEVENLYEVLRLLQHGIENNLEYFTDNSIPKGLMMVPGADPSDIKLIKDQIVDALRKRDQGGNWARKNYNLPIVNMEGKFEKLQFSNVELDLISQQQWFTKLVWSTYGVTPTELGFSEDANRATSLAESMAFKRKVLMPYLSLIEYHWKIQIINDLPWVKGKYENKVLFDFDKEDLGLEMNKRQIIWGDWQRNLIKRSKALEKMGEEELDEEEGNVYFADVQKTSEQGLFGGTTGQTTDSIFGEEKTEEGLNESLADRETDTFNTFKRSAELKAKIPLAPGEKPPEGVTVQTGPRGGKFYETNGEPSGGEKKKFLDNFKKKLELLKKKEEGKKPLSDEEVANNVLSSLGSMPKKEFEENKELISSMLQGKPVPEKDQETIFSLFTKEGVKKREKGTLFLDKASVDERLREAFEKQKKDYELLNEPVDRFKIDNATPEQQKIVDEGWEEFKRKFPTDARRFKSMSIGGNIAMVSGFNLGRVNVSPDDVKDKETFLSTLLHEAYHLYSFKNADDIEELNKMEEELKAAAYPGFEKAQEWLEEMKEKADKIDVEGKSFVRSLEKAANFKAHKTVSPLALKEFERPSEKRLEGELKEHLNKLRTQMVIAIDELFRQKKVEVKAVDVSALLESVGLGKLWERVGSIVKGFYEEGLDKAGVMVDQNPLPDLRVFNFIHNYAFGNIKDLDEETRNNLRQQFEQAVLQGESKAKLKQRIKIVFDKSDARIATIVRTELNRAENIGKLQGFRESAVKGKIMWKANPDAEIICQRLDGQLVKPGQLFEDKTSGLKGVAPPFPHPNCKCTIIFIPDGGD